MEFVVVVYYIDVLRCYVVFFSVGCVVVVIIGSVK